MRQNSISHILFTLILALLACACVVPPRESPPTPILPLLVAPTVIPIVTPVSGPCQLTVLAEVTVYERPSRVAPVFGILPAGVNVIVEGQTADGWLGFSPDVAQAANIGVFRLRWVEGGANVRLEGGCANVQTFLWVPQPGLCYIMPMEETPVYATPATTAPVLATLKSGDFAAVSGKTSGEWIRVDLSVSNTQLNGIGWVEQRYWNFNGPCDNLPVVTP